MTRILIVVTALLCGLQARAQEQLLAGKIAGDGAVLWLVQGTTSTPLQVPASLRKDVEALVGRTVKVRVLARKVDVQVRPDGRADRPDSRSYEALPLQEVLEPRLLASQVTVRRSGAIDLALPDAPEARPLQVIGPARDVLRARPDRAKVFVRGWVLGDQLLLLGVRAVTTTRTVLRIGPPWASFPASELRAGSSVWLDRSPVNGLAHLAGGALVRVRDVTFDPTVEHDRPVVISAGAGLVGALDD